MKRSTQIWIYGVCVTILLIAAGFLAGWFWAFANRPLNPSLANLASQSAASPTPQNPDISYQLTATISLPTPLPSPETYATPIPMPVVTAPAAPAGSQPLCGGPQLMYIQVAGNDNFNLADAIRIVRVDFVKPQVSVLAIQRATWVAIPRLAEHGITNMLVNSAHSYGVHWFGPNGGVLLLSQTIAQNFGIQSDHYLDIKFDSFVKAVDAVGGVDVDVPADLNGTIQGFNKNFKAGPQHMDGATALIYVRIRFPDNDWKRIDRQTLMVLSLFKQLTAPANLIKLPGLANQVKDDFLTDLSPIQITQLVCLATKINLDQVKFYEIGQDMVVPTVLNDKELSQIMLPKYDLIRPYVANFINGTLP